MSFLRTLTYRRANWYGRQTGPLANAVIEAHRQLSSTQSRTFQYREGLVEGLHWEERDGFSLFHVAQYIPRQATSLVPSPSVSESAANTSKLDPPSGKEYLTGDIMFLMAEDHVLLCPSGAREAVVGFYIDQVLRKVGQSNLAEGCKIEAVANSLTASQVQQEGVKRIRLNTTFYEATAEHRDIPEEKLERRRLSRRLMAPVAEAMLRWFPADSALSEIQDKENLSVQLVITYDARRKGGEMGRARIGGLAAGLLEEDGEGFQIETREGKKISPRELKITKQVELVDKGNSVDRRDAWLSLIEFYRELDGAGILTE